MKTAELLLSMTLVGALIGWVTNRIAVRMLFRPRRAVRIPLTPWRLEGLLPRRRAELAKAVADTVRRELLPPEALLELWEQSRLADEVEVSVRRHVQERVEELGGALPRAFKASIGRMAAEIVGGEVRRMLARLIPEIGSGLAANPELERIVEARILALNLDELEALVLRLAGKELGHIEALGALLGGIIGLLQGLTALALT